jgi:hypothetical protein
MTLNTTKSWAESCSHLRGINYPAATLSKCPNCRARAPSGCMNSAGQKIELDAAGVTLRSLRVSQPFHWEARMTLQKFMRWNLGSLSASTSAFTLPKVVSGLCLMPS